MFQPDEKKIIFVTPHGLYCYKFMSFRLKNDGATYQRLITKVSKPLISRVMEVYIDDIVVKSETRVEHVQYLEEIFHLMWAYNMKLNSTKCTFGISVGKLLGLMVTQRGIEVNPIQIKVVLETPVLSSKKELQHLTSRLAVLKRFIAYFIDKLRHFFLTLREASTFSRTDEYRQAFEVVKHYLTELPILSSPEYGENSTYIWLYLTMSLVSSCFDTYKTKSRDSSTMWVRKW